MDGSGRTRAVGSEVAPQMTPKLAWSTTLAVVLAASTLVAGSAGASDPSADVVPQAKIINVDGAEVELLPPLYVFNGPGATSPLPPVTSVAGDDTSSDQQEEPKCKVIGSDEKKLAEKINNARDRRKVRLVDLDMEISAVAAVHSRAMKRENELRHTGEQKLRQRVTRWWILGENVGRGMNVDSLHEAFMESSAHRKTVTDERFRHVGVGIARDENQVWVTVLFESRQDPGTTIDLPPGC